MNLLAFLTLFFSFSIAWASPSDCQSLLGGRSLPSQRYESASKVSRMFWDSYSQNFYRESFASITANLDTYLQAKHEGSEYIRFLEDLGFDFETKPITVPSLLSLFDKVEIKIQKLIREGKIQENEALWPNMNILARSKGYIPFEDYAAPGAELSFASRVTDLEEFSAYHRNPSLLTVHEFGLSLSDSQFPIDGMAEITPGGIGIMHDLAHMAAMIQNPEYMSSVKRGYSDLISYYGNSSSARKALNQESPLGAYKLFVAMETLSVVRQDSKQDLIKVLGLQNLLNVKTLPSRATIQVHYQSMSDEQVSQIIEHIVTNQNKYFLSLGALQNDLFSMNVRAFHRQAPLMHLIRHLNPQDVNHRLLLAKFAKFVVNTKDYGIKDWIQNLISPHLSTDPRWTELGVDEEVFSAAKGENFLLGVFSY